jgi:hypothetical protein
MGEGGGDNRTVVEVLLLQQEHAINSFLSLSLLHFLPLLFCRAGPAAAVLQLDDVITHINGTTLAGQQIDGIVSLMRGVSTITHPLRLPSRLQGLQTLPRIHLLPLPLPRLVHHRLLLEPMPPWSKACLPRPTLEHPKSKQLPSIAAWWQQLR